MTRSAPVCEFCDATAVREIEPTPGSWTTRRQGAVVLVAPYRHVLLCRLHEDLPVGVCDCPGRYGVTGVPCSACGKVREHLGRRSDSPARQTSHGW